MAGRTSGTGVAETLVASRAGSLIPQENIVMLYWAAVFFIIALVAALFGFGGLAAGAVGIAKILFFVFLILAIVSLIFGRRAPV
jgi:uncharacterized membrane protein YtjA (UPF0391 family)